MSSRVVCKLLQEHGDWLASPTVLHFVQVLDCGNSQQNGSRTSIGFARGGLHHGLALPIDIFLPDYDGYA